MIKKILLLLILMSFFTTIKAQMIGKCSPNITTYNTWSIGGFGSMTYPNTDIAASNFFDKNRITNYGIGLTVNKSLSHTISLQLRGFRGVLEGDNKNLRYRTRINYQTTINGVVNIGNITFLRKYSNFNLYGFLGIGVINFNSELFDRAIKGGFAINKNQYEQVGGWGLGLKYKVNDKISLNGEYTLSMINDDNLDGYFQLYSYKDVFSNFNFGLSYTLGWHKKSLEWENPIRYFACKDDIGYSQFVDSLWVINQIENNKSKNRVDTLYIIEQSTPINVVESVGETRTVYFNFNSIDLKPIDQSYLKDIAISFLNGDYSRIKIKGYTDIIGKPDYNNKLSNLRANAVKDYLIKNGVDEDSIKVEYLGSSEATSPIQSLNRKVEIIVK